MSGKIFNLSLSQISNAPPYIYRAFKEIQDCINGGMSFTAGLYADHIYELTSAHGVDIDGVLLKDHIVYTDHIAEYTASHGIILDNILKVDHITEKTGSHKVVFDTSIATDKIYNVSVGGEIGLYPDSGGVTIYSSTSAQLQLNSTDPTATNSLAFMPITGGVGQWLITHDASTGTLAIINLASGSPEYSMRIGSATNNVVFIGNIAMASSKTVDGVDVSAHAAGTAYSQHALGVGNHTHQTSGAEGNTLDHGLALTGLGDDDHPQYILVAGTRAFTGSQSLGGFSLTNVEKISLNHIGEYTGAHNIIFDNTLDANANFILNPKGIGSSTGKRTVYADQYAGATIIDKIHAAATDGGAGCTVIIPSVDYTGSNLPQFVPASYVTYQGGGKGVTVLQFADMARPIDSTAKLSYQIKDLTFKGTGYLGTWNQIPYWYNTRYCIYDNVEWQYMAYCDFNYATGMNIFKNCSWNNFLLMAVYLRMGNAAEANYFLNPDFYAVSRTATGTRPAIQITNSTRFQVFNNITVSYNASYNAQYGFQVDAGSLANLFVGGNIYAVTADWLDNGTNTQIDIKNSAGGRRNLNHEWLSFITRTVAPTVNGQLSVSDLTSIQGLKAYLASAEQTVLVKAYLAALDTVLGMNGQNITGCAKLSTDHIGEATGSHTIVLDNTLTSLNVLPAADGTYDIGTEALQIKNIFAKANISQWVEYHHSEFLENANFWVKHLHGSGAAYAGMEYLVAYTSVGGGDLAIWRTTAYQFINGYGNVWSNRWILDVDVQAPFVMGSNAGSFLIPLRIINDNTQEAILPALKQYVQISVHNDGKFYGGWCDGVNAAAETAGSTTLWANGSMYKLRIVFRVTVGYIDFYVQKDGGTFELIASANTNIPSGVSTAFCYYEQISYNGTAPTYIALGSRVVGIHLYKEVGNA